jgi:hypothetical protein
MTGTRLRNVPPMLTDNDLLEFDASTLAMADAGDARHLLHEHGDVFRAQLVAARWLDGYLRRRPEGQARRVGRHSEDHETGFAEAMHDAVAHLRQSDSLPGGPLYEDEQKRDHRADTN